MDSIPNERLQSFLNSTTTWWIGLVVAILILALIIHRIRAWYRGSDDPTDLKEEIIQQMAELNRRGELSDEEFRSIKGQISHKNQI